MSRPRSSSQRASSRMNSSERRSSGLSNISARCRPSSSGPRSRLSAATKSRCQRCRSGKVAKAFEHALQLPAAALPVIGGEELLRVFFVVFGELALERRELRGRERREHRCRVFRRFCRKPAVAQAHVGQAPREVPRGDARGRALARTAQQGGVCGKLVCPVPLVKSRDARRQVVGLRRVEVQIARRHEAQHGVGVVVGDAGRAAGREAERTDCKQEKPGTDHHFFESVSSCHHVRKNSGLSPVFYQ